MLDRHMPEAQRAERQHTHLNGVRVSGPRAVARQAPRCAFLAPEPYLVHFLIRLWCTLSKDNASLVHHGGETGAGGGDGFTTFRRRGGDGFTTFRQAPR
jgi:hypothetical protein